MLRGVMIMVGREKCGGNYIMIREGKYVVSYCDL